LNKKIFIDGVIFQIQQGRPAGISRVWLSLLSELAKSSISDKIIILNRGNSLPNIEGFKAISINEYDQNTFESDSLYLQNIIDNNGGGFFLSTYYTYPENSPCSIILHDFTPEAMSLDLNHPEWRAKQKAIQKCSSFFSVSESTKKDFIKYYPEHASKSISVIPNSTSAQFVTPFNWEKRLFEKTFSIKKPYYIFNGHRLGYKNAISFIKAFNLLPNKDDYEIFFTGGAKELETVFVELLDKTKYQIQFLNDAELSAAYSGAVALVYPSLYEGFGLPILEAMKLGCPVIAGNNSSIPEVAGDSAILIDSKNIFEMKEALIKVQNIEIRNDLIEKGYENVKRFSWKNTGKIFVQTLETLFENLENFSINKSEPINSWQRYLNSFYNKPSLKELLKAYSDSIKCFNAQGLSFDFSELIETEKRIIKQITDIEFEELLSACKKSKNDYMLIYWSGIILESKGQFDEALNLYLKLFKNRAPYFRITLLAANLAYKLGRTLTAEKLYRIIVSNKIKHAESINRLKELSIKITKVKEGMEISKINYAIDNPLETNIELKNELDELLISVIIPTKDRNEGLEEVLSSLPFAMHNIKYETILYFSKKYVDDLKPVIDKYKISKVFYDEDVFKPGEKFSWSKMMNHGFTNSTGKWIVYASDDIEFYPFSFWNALNSIKKNDKVGGITFLHKNIVETYGNVFDNYGYDQVDDFPYINFGLINKNAYNDVLGFDEKFKFYWADVDLCLRIWEVGYRIETSPYSLVDHNNITDRLKQENSGDRYFSDTSYFFDKWEKKSLVKKDKILLKKRKYLSNNDLENIMENIQSGVDNYLYDKNDLSENFLIQKIDQTIKTLQGNSNSKETNGIKVSAIVSTYNSERFFRGCLDDLINQSLYRSGELEIVIVNSGSVENEESIVKEYQSKYDNFKYLKTEKEYIYSAWNRAIKLSSGRYITNANTDDRHRYDAFEIMANQLDQNENIGLVYADQFVTYRENETFDTHTASGYFEWPEFDRMQLIHCAICGPQPMWRKTLHENFGYFNDSLVVSGDYEWWLRISDKVLLKHIPEKLGLYFLSDESIEHRHNNEMISETIRIRKQYLEKENIKSLNYNKYKSTFLTITEKPVLFSVIITTYNRLDKLKNAVKSVLEQNYNNLELIVVNDGGVKIDECLNKFSDDRIKIINREQNNGPAAARNSGLKIAQGKYIAFLDDDDLFLNNHLETALRTLRKGNKVVYTDAYRYTYKRTGADYKLIKKSIPYSIDYDMRKLLLGNISPVNCFVFEKDLINKAGLFNEEFSVLEDWEFWIRLSNYSDFYHIKKATVIVNWKDDGTTITSSKQKDFKFFHEKINRLNSTKINSIENKSEIISEFQKIWISDSILKPIVSIIIPTFNQLKYTQECIQSIYKNTTIPFELIVIANNKNDGTVEYLNQLCNTHNYIKLIINDENKGFPISVNQGISNVSAEFLLILNNDVVVTNSWLETMVDIANKKELVGIVGPISNEVSGMQKDKEANYNTIDEMHLYAASLNEKNKNRVLQFPRVAFLCTLIKREVFEKIGGLDERFSPGNYEDDDFCLRAQLAGYKTVIAQDVFIHHYGSKSFKADGEKKYAERLQINRKKFVDKWGADPDEIWVKQKPFNHSRSLFISIDTDEFIKSFERAQNNIKDKEYELALSELELSIRKYDSSGKAYSIISKEDLLLLSANVSMIIKDLEKAKTYFEEILKLNPASSEACFGLGQIFYQIEMFEESKTMLEWAVKNNPANTTAVEALKSVNEVLSLPENHNSLFENEVEQVEQKVS
jgi:GT2 family glycosyltransferase/glycosyltransferase involved in cell wall biosynthesis